jgi:hypothetical protein
MTLYRVTFFKNLLSSDGHQFKCPQDIIEIRRARTKGRAIRAAQLRYERGKNVRNWNVCADLFEVEAGDPALNRQSSRRHVQQGVPDGKPSARSGGSRLLQSTGTTP